MAKLFERLDKASAVYGMEISAEKTKMMTNNLPVASTQKIIAEEHVGFRPGKKLTDQIFNLRILYEKYLPHQQDLYHEVFIDFKRAFDRAWHAALWATMKEYNNSANLIRESSKTSMTGSLVQSSSTAV